MSPHLVQSIYAPRHGEWLDPPCSILIRLARARGKGAPRAQVARVAQIGALRGGPISAGWNRAAEASVHSSDNAKSLPMLEVPGCAENHRLPNAVAVISALNSTARVSADSRKLVSRASTHRNGSRLCRYCGDLTGLAKNLRRCAVGTDARASLKAPWIATPVRLPLRPRSGLARSSPAPRSRARFRSAIGLAPRSPRASVLPRFPPPPAPGAHP
jgi:hypothetical protein